MEFKQLQSFVEVVKWKSFTKAASQLYISQPTISTHIRQLEEELCSRLIIRTTKSIEITPRGQELYECAVNILEIRDQLIRRWASEADKTIQLGASTIPSAYIIPEILPAYGKIHPEIYFVIHQSDSQGVAESLLDGRLDLGMSGMKHREDVLEFIPFYQDRMVLITPVAPRFLELKKQGGEVFSRLLQEPVILREQGSGSYKTADLFLESIGIREKDLHVAARINDQESIKNLVAGGLGISIISQRAAWNFAAEKRLLMFDLPKPFSGRNLYLVYRKDYILRNYIRQFIAFVRNYYKS